nr:uncharacterized protein LOC107025672 [Ipomoea batatas]
MQPFLEASYFTCCEEHNDLEKSGLNKFCVTCVAPLCNHCIQTKIHKRHDLLTIYHHSHKDVVPLKQIKKHIRCSQIQVYKCNRQWVVALHLPKSNEGEGSRSQDKESEICKACKRKLHKRSDGYHFCSIACMVENEREEAEIEAPPPVVVRHRRKGIPHRSPQRLIHVKRVGLHAFVLSD